jgi:hypothetical protein
MKKLYYKGKELLPEILLDKEAGLFRISGVSCPMDPHEFFEPIFDWFIEYFEHPLEKTVLDLNMTYFNTASAKFLLKIMTNLNKLSEQGHDIKIRWFYSEEDFDMMEEGEEFKSILSVDFELIPIEDDEPKEDFNTFMKDII